ncbi:DUF305 domain-containing protein [Streptomyces radicis]|uniref:DUF305 domain-containing protein n=1 Tax=Streptomyces radicis TaxID=1750517 RepID=A0A3A9X1R9_9ACTN|nr:DUF305 domain-containing protein [Streptomyces radicis]RKN12437.1 DUF305 domain-containing protein [Streptomyces radicis]RKN27793.1 DUF305 domain-containing protein [Streptomyces radicis]
MSTTRHHRSPLRLAAIAASATAAALLLTGCGGDDGGSGHGEHGQDRPTPEAAGSAPATSGEHNAADIAFAQGMIPHHRQAVDMADLAPEQGASDEVLALAERIRAAQDPEIETLSGWLAAWGEPVPEEGMDHAGHDMGGMMSAEEMAELENATGAAFDAAFLAMMVQHHEGAVEMAGTELADGSYPPALDLAEDIVASQSAEIDQMNEMLGAS